MPDREILVVLDYFDPECLGGGARVAFEESRVLARRGHRVTILAGSRIGGEVLLDPGIRFIRHRYDRRGERGLASLPRALLAPVVGLARRYRARPDAILLHQPLSAALLSLWPAAGRAIRIYHFLSPWPEECEARRGRGPARRGFSVQARRWIERAALARADRILVASRFMASRLASWHPRLPAARVALTPFAVDVETFRPRGDRRALREKLGLPAGRPIALTVRRLTPRMGLENLLEAAALVRAEIPEILFVIVGEGELRATLEAKIDGLRLRPNVRLWGYAPGDALPELYGAADLFVLPTWALEGFGLVTLEALACGLPVLGTPVGGTAEILSRLDPDFLFDDPSPPAIARGILRFLQEAWAARFPRQRLRAFVLREYSWERTVDAIEGMIEAGRGSALRACGPRAPTDTSAARTMG